MKKHGKKYQEVAKLVDQTRTYTVEEACELIKKTNPTKFDATVGINMSLNINTKKADQQIRGTVVLPNGTGKNVRVLVLTNTKQKEATEAGADYVGGKELLDKIVSEKWFDYDVICATPDMMGEIGKAGRILGPKGLMPNPKTGTVGMEVSKMVTELKAGKVEYRADREGNVNLGVGKISFDAAKLAENVNTIISTILRVRPSTVKGVYVKTAYLSSTMGPSIKIAIN